MTEKYYVIITFDGFLMIKKENELDKNDDVVTNAISREEAEEIVHGKKKNY